ncbi:IPT/TIG domain-containing protein [Flavobacterium sp.]|uniref:IPT/TIG domain-containing protein n=1 Tax=Flavobacterium sp. TaxID=239 RepID=UPI003D0F80CB
MSIQHNRIKVADLEKNQPNKILITNINGEIEFTEVGSIQIDRYNALDYTASGKALDARQGKILNDTKVDKVAGERLINTAEINKISSLTNVTTIVKSIFSTALVSQNLAGFVNYINGLNPNLTVGANEIVKYTIAETGRIYELNLRGRSFGAGQSPINDSDVTEITEFLNKDIKLTNYPLTRNDGQLSTNKVLSTDASGNLKLYSLPTFSVYPAPFLRDVSPISILPNSTQNLTFEGAFFTPDMTLLIVGQTVNYITFITDNLIKVNVTTGSAQGNFDVILNNGRIATFTDAILIVLGTVYNSIESEWVNKTNIDVSEIGSAKCIADNLNASAKWTRIIDVNKNFSIRFNLPLSPMSNSNIDSFIAFNDIVTGENKFYFEDYGRGEGDLNRIYYGINGRQIGYFTTDRSKFFELKKIGNIVTASYHNADILISTVSNTTTFSNNLEVAVYLKNSDVSQLKYIELAI